MSVTNQAAVKSAFGAHDVTRSEKLREWRDGGSMLAAAMICCCFSVFPVNILGALINPLETVFGWSRAAITAAVLITACGTIVSAPIAGHMVDRIGPRRMALIFLPLLSMAVALIGLAGPSIWSWYACWAVFAVVQACAGYVVYTKAVVARFDLNRGLALGVMLSGAALAHGLLPGFAVWVMSEWDWRAIYFILAAATLVVGWPLAWAFFHGSGEPVGAGDAKARAVASVKPDDCASASQPAPRGFPTAALRSPQFWQLALSFFILAAAVAALYVHFLPILSGAGFSAQQAATVAIVLGPAAIIGRLGAGFLLDRFPPHLVVAAAMIVPIVSYCILLVAGSSLIAAYLCAALIGLVLGAEADFMAYLVSRYFGQQTFGALYGLMLGIFAVGYGAGPVLTGKIFDVTRSYELSFYLFAAAALVGSVLIARLGPPARATP